MMNENRFQERWDFRRREEDANSSSDDCKSNSSDSPDHKSVLKPVSSENEETGDVLEHAKSKKPKRKQPRSRKKDTPVKKIVKEPVKKVGKKKNKNNDPASMEGLKVFMESLLKDLAAATENLLVWMRDEMHKLSRKKSNLQPKKRENNFESGLKLLANHTTDETAQAQNTSQAAHIGSDKKLTSGDKINQNNLNPGLNVITGDRNKKTTGREANHAQNTVGLGLKAEKWNLGSIDKFLNDKKLADFNYPHRVSENQVKILENSRTVTLTEKKKEHGHGLLIKQNVLSSSSVHVPSSMYLGLPKINSLPSNNIPSQMSPMLGESHRVHYAGMQKEQYGNISQVGMKNASFTNQNNAIASSRSGYPVLPHQGLDRHFTIPNHGYIKNQPLDTNGITGMTMNGGSPAFSQGNNQYSEDLYLYSRLMEYQNRFPG